MGRADGQWSSDRAAIAFAHLRRPKQRFWIKDEGDTLVFNGALDWVTTWPLADVVLIEGYRQDSTGRQQDEIISVLIEPPHVDLTESNQIDRDDIQAGPSLSLAAMGGTQTWPVSFIDYRVPVEQVVSRIPADKWLHENSLVSADANPAGSGWRVQRSTNGAVGDRYGSTKVAEVARQLSGQLRISVSARTRRPISRLGIPRLPRTRFLNVRRFGRLR